MTRQVLRILESFPEPRATTNPYIVQLMRALRASPDLEVSSYTTSRALFGRYDVFHVHWPENLFGGHRMLGRLSRRLRSTAFFLRLQLTRTPVVRTWHNVDRPQGLGRIDRALWAWLDRLTTLRIRLNDTTAAAGLQVVTIPHGDYRDWYAPFPRAERLPGRVAYAGLVREYKGVDALMGAFLGIDDPQVSLSITGRAANDEAAAAVRSSAHDDPRVLFDLRYVDDADLVSALTRATLVALPYRHFHNSGTVLAALSLDRPVLVPDTEVTRRLAEEVGDGWVLRYSGDLTSADLAAALADAARLSEDAAPDLSRRGWAKAGAAHAEAFRLAVRLRRGR